MTVSPPGEGDGAGQKGGGGRVHQLAAVDHQQNATLPTNHQPLATARTQPPTAELHLETLLQFNAKEKSSILCLMETP